ncbi:MAG: hypothetical protein QG628_341 [Patescibacteria group bacterium]|jgi:hypothetical protein|nr:hypothetical protein [Patescibacteria group bacterium]
MFLAALLLTAVGLLSSLLGLKLFRIILPIVGLVTGFMVGFGGFQGVFGSGVISSTMAVLVAVVTGLIFALLAFALFELSIKILGIVIGASVLSFLGVAVGLDKNGFIVFCLAVAGGILAALLINARRMSLQLVVAVTSLAGVAYILTGIMLVAGKVSLTDLSDSGIIPTLLRVVDQSFLWLFVWLGGSILAMQVQYRLAVIEFLNDSFAYVEVPETTKRSAKK